MFEILVMRVSSHGADRGYTIDRRKIFLLTATLLDEMMLASVDMRNL